MKNELNGPLIKDIYLPHSTASAVKPPSDSRLYVTPPGATPEETLSFP